MHEVVEAEHLHRQFLQEFWCGPIPFRKAKKLARPHDQEYAIRVQSIIRQLKPRVKCPDRIFVCFLDDLRIVKSVGWAGFTLSTNGHHNGYIHVLATHLVYTRQGAGQATYSRILEGFIELAQDADNFESLTLTALVHPDNMECKSLLTGNGWIFTEALDVDGLHEEWALVIGVDP